MKKYNQNIQNGAELQGRTGPRTDRQILEKHAGVQERVHGYMKKGKLRRIIAVLSAFVLLFTLNSLKFKADTLQRLPMCGLTEHVHSEACYNEDGALVCGLTEHEHTDACYQQRPVQPEPTVIDEFVDLNSQVVLASPMDDEDVNISSENVDAAVGETTLDLDAEGAGTGAEADSGNGLEVEYDLDDLYDENGDETVTTDDVTDNGAGYEDNADEVKTDYSLNGGSTAFLSDIMRAAGLEVSGVTAVGEIVNDAFVEAHIAAEPVEGVDDEYVIKVLESFDRVELGVATADSMETVWLTDGQAVAPEAPADTAVEDAPAVEAPAEPSEEIVEQNEEIFNSNEIIETEPEQTEVGEIETEVGGADEASDIGETTEAVPAENDESVTGAADTGDAQDADDTADVEDQQTGEAQDDDTAAVEDQQTGEAQDDDTAAVEDQQTGEAQDDDTAAVEDQQTGEAQDADDTADVEGQQTGEAQDDDTAAVDDQTGEAQDDDTATVEDQQTGEAQDDDTDAVDDQTGDDQTDEAAVVKTVTLDFTDYNVEDAHAVYLFDAEMGAVLVNTAEIDSVDGVAVMASGEEEAADEASTEEADEASADEGGVLVIKGDGEYALNGTNYVVTGLIIPGKSTGEAAQAGDEAQVEDAPADEAQADDAAADGDQPADDGQAEAAVAAEKAVTLDFTDYIATEEHAVYLYDATMVAVLVSEAEIASADGVAVTLPEEAAEADGAQAEEAQAEETPAEEDAQAKAETIIITGDGEYALNGTTYVVTGLVLPEKTVENDNITITTANDEATLLNVAPVFEETDEDYDDIFSLFTMAQDDPTLLAKVFDLLGGVAYAEDGEAGRDLNVKVFKIGLEDVTTGEAVEPGTELHVVSSLDTPISGEDFQLYHIADGKAELIPDAVVVEDGRAVGLNFNTVSLDKFALVYYTVNVVVEDKNITVGVDFTDVVANGVDFDAETILTALNNGVAIDVASLLAGDADGALSVNVEGDALNVDVNALSVVTAEDGETAEEGVTYADGSVRVTGDGSVVLTDGEYTLNIVVTNYTKLLADRLEAEGVSIEVVEGEVPAGSTVTYEALSADATEALVEAYIPEAAPAPAEEAAPAEAETAASGAEEAATEASGETVEEPGEATEEAAEAPGANQTEEKNEIETATGYTAFDVSVAMPEGDAFTDGGEFAVTVEHAVDAASLVPEGAVIDSITYELFHIHNGEATQIEDVAVANGQVSFTTDGFSEYVIRYTVDFHYNGMDYSIPGNTQILLTQLIEIMHITVPENDEAAENGEASDNGALLDIHEVASVEFTDAHLVQVDQVSGLVTINGTDGERADVDAGDYNFLLSSLEPFSTNEKLTITLKDGTVIEVGVTDMQQVIIEFFEADGATPAPATSGEYNYIVAGVQTKITGFSPITIEGVSATGMLDIVPGDELSLIRYEGSDILTNEYLSNNWWYDPSGNLKSDKSNLDGAELGVYKVSKIDQLHYKAVKKPGYTVTLNFVDRTRQNSVTPGQSGAPAITDTTYVGAHVRNEQGDVVGYAIAKMPTNSDSNSVVFDKVMIFRENQNGTDNISYTDAKNRGYYINDVVIRHYTGNQQIQNAPSYEQFTGSEWTTDASDGYTFASRDYLPQGNGNSSNDSTGCVITQRLADPTEYFVKVDCGNDALTIPEGFKLYAKVNVNNGARYGFVQLAADEGNTFKGQVTQWYNSDGTLADKQSINGHENNVTVCLHAVQETQNIDNPNMLNDSNAVSEGGVIQTHEVVSYPSIPKDYDPSTATGTMQRKIESNPGIKTVYTDYVYLEKNDDRMTDYSLETLLERYNVITLCPNTDSGHVYNGVTYGDGDFVYNQHTVGGALVRGDLIIRNFNSIGGGEQATQPSAVGGAVIWESTTGQIIGGGIGHDGRHNPFYVGEVNQIVDGKQYVDGQGLIGINTYGPTIANDDYVDWDALQASIIRHSRAMASSVTRTVTIEQAGYQTIAVQAGEKIRVVYGSGVDPEYTYITVQLDLMNQEFSTLPGTVISFVDGGKHHIPKLETLNGSLPGAVDDGDGISVIYNFPQANAVDMWDGNPEYGHVIAPLADAVLATAGNYNGCVIANSLYSSSEGHLSPYKGGTIVGFYGKVSMTKTVENKEPTDRQVFRFVMQHLRNAVPESEYQEGIGKGKTQDQIMWDYIGTTTNNHGSVEFDKVPFYEAGTYYFLVYESTDKQYPDITLDTTKYVVKVEVDAVTSGDNVVLSINSGSLKYYKVTNEQNLITVNHDTTTGEYHATINQSAMSSLTGEMTWENSILNTPIEFRNKEKKSGITIQKVVTGTDDKTTQFPFKLYVWFEDTESGSISYTAYNGDVKANGESKSFESINFKLESEDTTHPMGRVEFNLMAATPVNFVGLPVGAHYAFVENESEMPDGYTFKSKENDTGVVPAEGAPSTAVTFINNYYLTTVNVTKAWSNADGTTTAPDTAFVTFDLYAGSTKKASVKLNGAADKADDHTKEADGTTASENTANAYESAAWVATWSNLPKVDDNGDEIRYTVKEALTEGEGWAGYTVSYASGDSATTGQTITNTQTPAKATPEVTKAFTNGDGHWPKEGENETGFTFTLAGPFTSDLSTEHSDQTMVEMGTTSVTVKSTDEELKKAFGEITFKKAGDYYFTITETVPGDAKNANGVTYSEAEHKTGSFKLDGITYDATPHSVRVKVTNTNGKLAVESGYPQYDDDKASLTVTNSYSAEGEIPFSARKDFTDGKNPVGQTAGQFSFTLTETDSNWVTLMTEEATPVAKLQETKETKDVNGAVDFTSIPLTEADVGTRYFTIVEVIPEGATEANNYTWNNIKYDRTIHKIKVEIQDDGKGGLTVTKTDMTAPGQGTAISTGPDAVFTNTKLTKISASKTWVSIDNKTINPANVTLTLTLKRYIVGSSNVEDTGSDAVKSVSFVTDGAGNITKTVGGVSTLITLPDVTDADYNEKYASAWSHEWENLPLYSADGTEYTYQVTETFTGNYYQDSSIGADFIKEGNQRFRNVEISSYELPSTGGPGTTMFYVIGSVLTLLAAVLLITKRRIGALE